MAQPRKYYLDPRYGEELVCSAPPKRVLQALRV